jgi:uncharacterized protein YbaR (Trm112 family)
MPQRVRDLLVCPRCHGALQDVGGGLRCETCDAVYPVVHGIPVLLIDEARPGGRRRR